jgi:hypothetical protein
MRFSITFILALLLSTLAQSADMDDFEISGTLEFRLRPGERIVLGGGGCAIVGPGFSIESDRLVLWCHPAIELLDGFPRTGGTAEGEEKDELPRPKTAEDILGPLIHAIYAVGNVRYERGAETITAKRLLVDFKRDRAIIDTTRVATTLGKDRQGNAIPLIITAETVRRISKDKFTASSAKVTTCDFAEAHFHLDVSKLTGTRHADGWGVKTSSGTLRIGNTPVFWFPFLSMRSDLSMRPLRSVRAGKSSRFGYILETLWGDTILTGPEEDRRRWGEWGVHIDERTRRGIGAGLDLDYETDLYMGRLRSYYQRDGATKDKVTDEFVPKEDRGRIWLQHRFDLKHGWRLDLETHLESDAAYRDEFLREESRRDKDPETYVQFRKLHGNMAAFGLARYRGNDHDTQTEAMPGVKGAVVSQPLASELLGLDGGQILLDVEGSLSRARRHAARVGDMESSDWIDRADANLGLRFPFSLGPVRLAALVSARGSSFSDSTDGGAQDRFATEAGARADLTLSRRFPSLRSALLGLNGVRHIVSFDLTYLNRWDVDVDPEKLVALDEIEDLDETEVVTLRMRNRFETRRGRKQGLVDALDVEVEAEFYPDREVVRGRDVHGLAFLEGRLLAPLTENLLLRMDADYDAKRHDWMTASTGVRYAPGALWSTYVEHRYIGGQQNLVSAWVDLRPTDRYGFRAYAREDFRRGKLNRAGILIRRFGHDWVLEADLYLDKGLDDFGIKISLLPRGFGGGPLAQDDEANERTFYGEGF